MFPEKIYSSDQKSSLTNRRNIIEKLSNINYEYSLYITG